VQAREVGFLLRVHGLALRDKTRGCEIRKTLNGESCILRIERSGIYKDRLVRHDPLAATKRKWPRCRPRTKWRDCISNLAWSVLVWSQQNYMALLLTVKHFAST